jgi:protein SCO1
MQRSLIECALTLIAFGCAGECLAAGAAEIAHAGKTPRTVVSMVNYTVPDVRMVTESGKNVSLRQELDDGRPVMVNFIFTTCASTCPLSSETFSIFQDRLAGQRSSVHLVSISIDPEQDTPERLREYAKSFSAGPSWQHYTGTLEASQTAQRAFGVYRGDKMGHTPVTLLRAAPGKVWRRIDGFVTPEDLMREYQAALKTQE